MRKILAVLLLCLLVCIIVGCKAKKEFIEVEKWQHDTTTIVDTVHVKDVVTLHDSIYITNTITEHVKDSTQTDVSWQHYTFDKDGNVSSMTNYNSSTHHGISSNTATESAQTSVSNNTSTHEETGSHSESSGHSEASKEKVYVKVGLNKWQQFVMVLGYAMLVLLACGAVFGGYKIYRKLRK